jgi:hypothetical protein
MMPAMRKCRTRTLAPNVQHRSILKTYNQSKLLKLYLMINPLLSIQQIISGQSRDWTAKWRKGKTVEYLVKWLGYPESESTWEKKKDIDPDTIAAYESNLMLGHDQV